MTFIWLLFHIGDVLAGEVIEATVDWVPSLGIDLSFRLNGIAALMLFLISGVGFGVFIYAFYYVEDKPKLHGFAGYLTAFAGSMVGLVLSNNLLGLFVFWELTSVTSYMLIGTEDEKPGARAAALQALLTTGIGGLAMLAGFVLIGTQAGTFTISSILDSPPSGNVVTAGIILMLIGAFTKSAQFPFHSWLPGAMQAPTPISAYLHSATMVKAGVYLIALFAPAFATVTPWRPLVITVGLTTMLYGAYRSLYQNDLKLLLAYGTTSQLGFMVVLFGMGIPAATFAGAAVLLAHGIFKASLFMTVGVIDHQTHTRDLRMLSGLYRRMPLVFVTATLAAASMAAVPPMLGFVSKELGYAAVLNAAGGWWPKATFIAIFVASTFTVAYAARFVWGAFATKRAGSRSAVPTFETIPPESVEAPKRTFVAPALLLGLASLILGVFTEPASRIVNAAAASLVPGWQTKAMHLWPGVNLALVMSLVTLVLGAVLFWQRDLIATYQRPRLPDVANGAYTGFVKGLLYWSNKITAVVQSGSLPTYLLIILWTLALVPGIAAINALRTPDDSLIAESPFQIVVGVFVIGAAVATVRARRRFAAVMFVGAMGYGVSLLFAIQGAPDLALTQFLVDTVAIVAYVLVLRRLPRDFEPAPFLASKAIRLITSVVVGATVLIFAIAIGAPSHLPDGDYFLENTVAEAHGANAVNTLLVDFRAFDTLGEIAVVTIAGIGIASLIVAGRKRLSNRDSFADPKAR